MPVLIAWALLAVALIAAPPARADGIVHRVSGCGQYLFVSTDRGFAALVSSDTVGVKERDYLVGNVSQIGRPTLYDRTAGRSVFAVVEEPRLDLAEVNQRIALRCRSPLQETLASGTVTRVCGSWIFVNTPKGYALLERIAGGVVANDDNLTGSFNRPGRATVQDRQSASTLTVFVQDVWLSKSATDRKIQSLCR